MQDNKRILLVQDEPNISRIVLSYLEHEGYVTKLASDGPTAKRDLEEFKPDLIILDIMSSERGGLEVLRQIYADTDVPMILLTAPSEQIHNLLGVQLDKQGYLTKPFSVRELISRVKAILKYHKHPDENPIRYGPLELSPESMRVLYDGKTLDVTKEEYRLIECLVSQPDRVVSRDELLRAVLTDEGALERLLDWHLERLGEKFPCNPLAELVQGSGYRLAISEPS